MVNIKKMKFDKEGIREDLVLARAIEEGMIKNVSSTVSNMKNQGDSISFIVQNTHIWSIGNMAKGIMECQIADKIDGVYDNHRGKGKEYTWEEAINVVLKEKDLPTLEFSTKEYLSEIIDKNNSPEIPSSLGGEISQETTTGPNQKSI